MGSSSFRHIGQRAKGNLLSSLFSLLSFSAVVTGAMVTPSAWAQAIPSLSQQGQVRGDSVAPTPVMMASGLAKAAGDASAVNTSARAEDFPWNRATVSSEQVMSAMPAKLPAIPGNVWEAVRGRINPLKALRASAKYIAKYDVNKIGDRGIGGGMNFYSMEKEVALGRELSADVEANAKIFKDEQITEYVNRLTQTLVRNSDAKVMFTVKVIDNDEINAFALPGGFFYVNVGMLMAAESEAELAGVMAHEIAHVAARHATKNATKKDIWSLISIPLVFVGGPAGMIVQNVANLAVPMSFLKFSRNAEREADLLGLEYQYAAGYDPAAMITFFERVGGKEKKQGFLARAFSTHPMNADRVKRSQNTMEMLLPPTEQYLVSTSEFDEMKLRLAMLTRGRAQLGIQSAGGPTLRKTVAGSDEKSDDGPPVLKRN